MWSSDMPGAKFDLKEATAQHDGVGPCGFGCPIYFVPMDKHQQCAPVSCDALIAIAPTSPSLLHHIPKPRSAPGVREWGDRYFINSCR